MQVSSRWRIAALLAAALFVGSIVGPPLVQAASVGLVRIEGAKSSHQAKVSSSGQLSINANLPQTRAGQVKTAIAGADSTVVAFGFPTCASGGIYKVPAGKALIITSADFYNAATTPGSPSESDVLIGPAATPCKHFVAAGIATDDRLSLNQQFVPGIPVPAGDAVGLIGVNQSGSVHLYGYLVPASTVPATAESTLPAAHAGRPATLR